MGAGKYLGGWKGKGVLIHKKQQKPIADMTPDEFIYWE
jgi:hypothetical protein